MVRGDDFTVLADDTNLDWFESEMEKRFDIKKRGRLGPERKDMKAIRILNRVITWTEEGITYEADQRHAEIIIRNMRLEQDNAKSVVTPGEKEM